MTAQNDENISCANLAQLALCAVEKVKQAITLEYSTYGITKPGSLEYV